MLSYSNASFESQDILLEERAEQQIQGAALLAKQQHQTFQNLTDLL
jgi:hypothetical protein